MMEQQEHMIKEEILPLEKLSEWFDFLYEVFKEKGTSKQYFINHHENDPNPNSIFIAGIDINNDDKIDNQHNSEINIIGTVKVFHRNIFVNNKEKNIITIVMCGGIGEVSTKKEFRGKGIASNLLKKSIQYMKENNFKLSALHASKLYSNFYSNLGWKTILAYHSCFTLQFLKNNLENNLENNNLKQLKEENFKDLDFENENKIKEMMDLYDLFCKQFNGTIVRDNINYWKKWIKLEFTTHDCQSIGLYEILENNKQQEKKENLICYLVIGPNNSNNTIIENENNEFCKIKNFKVKEFIVKMERIDDAFDLFCKCFYYLLRYKFNNLITTIDNNFENLKFNISLPYPLFKVMDIKEGIINCYTENDNNQSNKVQCIVSDIKEKDNVDEGWMYQLIETNDTNNIDCKDFISEEKHVIWRTDHY
ncbi:hypothetical protein ABK040_003847 [Willaertia magna]